MQNALPVIVSTALMLAGAAVTCVSGYTISLLSDAHGLIEMTPIHWTCTGGLVAGMLAIAASVIVSR